jgi:hypothetical protein
MKYIGPWEQRREEARIERKTGATESRTMDQILDHYSRLLEMPTLAKYERLARTRF